MMRPILLALAVLVGNLPGYLPWSVTEKQSAATGYLVAALEAPQVGFEPTTLRLTETQGPEIATSEGNDLAVTPLVRCRYGFTWFHSSPCRPPSNSPDVMGPLSPAFARGYWAAAPPAGGAL